MRGPIKSGRRMLYVLAAMLTGVTSAPVQAAPDAQTLVSDTWTRYRSVNSEREESEILVVSKPVADYTRADTEAMVREDKSGVVHKRAVRHALYAPDHHDKIHLLFSLPAEDAGLGFLVWREPESGQDDMYLFMPGYRAVRRIPVSSKQRLAGTDLLYEDIRLLAGESTDRFTYTAAGSESVAGRAANIVEAKPKSGTVTAYGSRKMWIDAEWLFPLKVEFYDTGGKLWKVLRNSEIREVAPNVRRADLAEMRDVQENQCTLLLVTKRAVAVDIPTQVFTEDYLVHPGAD